MHSPSDTVVGIENAANIYRTAPHHKSLISLDSVDHLLSDTRDSNYADGSIAAKAGATWCFPIRQSTTASRRR